MSTPSFCNLLSENEFIFLLKKKSDKNLLRSHQTNHPLILSEEHQRHMLGCMLGRTSMHNTNQLLSSFFLSQWYDNKLTEKKDLCTVSYTVVISDIKKKKRKSF